MSASPYDALASFYDRVAGADDRDVALFGALARRVDAPVLELGVGSGRAAVPLALDGFSLHGIDASAAMLALAREHARAAGVRLRLHQADLCSYTLPERFGLVFCARDTFLHLTEPERQVAALRRAGGHLAAEGWLVLDLPALGGAWTDWEPGVRPLELTWSGEGPNGGAMQHFQTYTADAAAQIRHVTHLFDETDADGMVRRTTVSYDLRFVFPGELPLLVAAAGLRLEAVYGGYDLEPFAAGCERMIAVIAPMSDQQST